MVPDNPAGRTSNAQQTAWPVPCCCACTAARRSRPSVVASVRRWGCTASRPWPITTTRCSGASPATARTACSTRGRPAIGCSTLGIAECILVPSPAASTIAVVRLPHGSISLPLPDFDVVDPPVARILRGAVLPERARSHSVSTQRPGDWAALRRQDSNLDHRNQNPRCCLYTTADRRSSHSAARRLADAPRCGGHASPAPGRRGRDDLVAAGLLGAVHRSVGLAEQLLR